MPKTKEEILLYQKEYRAKHKAEAQAYRQANKAKALAYGKQYKLDNYDKCSEYGKQYRLANTEKIAIRNKKYRLANKEALAIYQKNWVANNHKKTTIYSWRKQGLVSEWYEDLYDHFMGVVACEICGVILTDEGLCRSKRCMDHDHETGLYRNTVCNSCNSSLPRQLNSCKPSSNTQDVLEV